MDAVGKRERGRPTGRADADARRTEFVKAVMKSIAQYGYKDVTVATICEAGGFSRGLMAHYFSSKDALLLHAVQEVASEFEMVGREAAVAAGPDPYDRLHAVIGASFRPPLFMTEKILIWVSLASTARWSRPLAEVYRNLYRPYRRALARLVSAAASQRGVAVNADRVAITLTQLVEGLWSGWACDPESVSASDAEAACHDFLNALLRGTTEAG